jgi:hypothetical protein
MNGGGELLRRRPSFAHAVIVPFRRMLGHQNFLRRPADVEVHPTGGRATQPHPADISPVTEQVFTLISTTIFGQSQVLFGKGWN